MATAQAVVPGQLSCFSKVAHCLKAGLTLSGLPCWLLSDLPALQKRTPFRSTSPLENATHRRQHCWTLTRQLGKEIRWVEILGGHTTGGQPGRSSRKPSRDRRTASAIEGISPDFIAVTVPTAVRLSV